MQAVVSPANASSSFVWSVTDSAGAETDLASITADGKLTAKGKNGTVKVTAATNDGSGIKGEVTVIIRGQLASITGDPYGQSPSWSAGSEFDKAFDGDTNTYYDYANANGGYTGIDLGDGNAGAVKQIRFYPRSGYTGRMVGGQFQGSNTSPTDGFVTFYTVTEEPALQWNAVPVTDPTAYRYLRYLSPNGSYGSVAEIEFYSTPSATLTWSGPTSVTSNQSFEVTLSLNTVTNNVYAQDMTLNYDPQKVEFISAEAIKPGLSIIDKSAASGQVRFLTADLQPDQVGNDSLDLIKVHFKAKEVHESQTEMISLNDIIFANGNGVETSIGSPDPWNFAIEFVDTTGVPGDVNGDSTVHIGDLAIVASHYGLTSADPDWNEFKSGDMNHDGKIDIEDLTAIARLIIG
ncbi:cohesin domain-containing protein [Paenibacillus hexagrammi]|uniref:Cohesin domain-containing protein n=1 Tax=Paenibacillus hexagrammi TaxID=2908839 RepID=A0ABY3SDA9_9BACL|nr:cohesin domain-containing protein [Paenibacillus sp. YPD9-1]UJF31470.1 cohesin domain-containing protein [Paenibacillus sp. YPD9-1]